MTDRACTAQDLDARDEVAETLAFPTLVLAGAMLLVALFATSTLTWPLSMDHGIIGYVAEAAVNGKTIYRDAFDQKGPFAYWTYALGLMWGGDRQLSLRILDLVILCAGSCSVALLLTELPWKWRIAASLACLAALLQLDYFNTIQPDAWAGLCVAFAMVAVGPSGRYRNSRIIVAGILCALAALHKPPFALFGIPLLMEVYRGDSRNGASRMILLVGASATVGTSALLLLHLRGELSFAYQAIVQFAAGEYQRTEHAWDRVARLGHGVGTLIKLAPWIVLLALPTKKLAQERIWWVWMAVALVIVMMQGRYFGYHWSILFPPAVCLTFTRLAQSATIQTKSRIVKRMLHSVAFACFAARPLMFSAYALASTAGFMTREQYLESFRSFSSPVPDQQALTAYLRTPCASGTRVFGWTADPSPFFNAGCNLTSRFSTLDQAIRPPGSKLGAAFGAEVDSAVRSVEPELVVRDRFFENDWGKPLSRVPSLEQFIGAEYIEVSQIGVFTVLKRRSSRPIHGRP